MTSKLRAVLLSIVLLFVSTLLFAQKKTTTPAKEEKKSPLNEALLSNLQFRSVGPAITSGRIADLAVNPKNHSEYYVAAAAGGVWKTTNAGITFSPLFDGEGSYSIGCVAIDPNNSNIVWVGSGENNNQRSVSYGDGIYKSEDAGKSWKNMGLKNSEHIGRIAIDPTNSDIVYVAAYGPVWSDGGDRGIYKTMDGGKSWEKLSKGLPQGLIGKIDLAVTPANSSILYAIIEAPGKEGGLYKSEDQGDSFKQVSSDEGLVNRPFYYCNVAADPKNADIVYSMANPMLKSVNGGISWTRVNPPHGDNHDIWINPNDPDLFIQSNDGGANITHNGGKTWSTQFNQPTAELYQVEVDDQYPYWLYAGQQDNYTAIAVPSFPPSAIQTPGIGWIINVGGCETGPAVPKPGDHNTVYTNCKGVFGVFNKKDWYRKILSGGSLQYLWT